MRAPSRPVRDAEPFARQARGLNRGAGGAMIAEHPLLNPVAAIPVLFVGTVAVALYVFSGVSRRVLA